MSTVLFLRINSFQILCSSLISFYSIYLVQALGVGVIKGPLHLILTFPVLPIIGH